MRGAHLISSDFDFMATPTPTSPLVTPPSQRRRQQTTTATSRLPSPSIVRLLLTCACFVALLPAFTQALQNVSVSVPQAVKRGSSPLLVCNYDLEDDVLYTVKWYKGRREFFRYTPSYQPPLKDFPQPSVQVDLQQSNGTHIVLNEVSPGSAGKYSCEVSMEAPTFNTALVSKDMEIVEIPGEHTVVSGIQPRYRIGDLVDGNCSIKYSQPAANLTWTINGAVVPPHHIKKYKIDKARNLLSVTSALHFMVTTHHYDKGQMRLKCTATIYDIFKEEIEYVIEEDRPKILASGHNNNYPYEQHSSGDRLEDHNESYLTYYSAASSIHNGNTPLHALRQQLQHFWLKLKAIRLLGTAAEVVGRAGRAFDVAATDSIKQCSISHLLLQPIELNEWQLSVAGMVGMDDSNAGIPKANFVWGNAISAGSVAVVMLAAILSLTQRNLRSHQNVKQLETQDDAGGKSQTPASSSSSIPLAVGPAVVRGEHTALVTIKFRCNSNACVNNCHTALAVKGSAVVAATCQCVLLPLSVMPRNIMKAGKNKALPATCQRQQFVSALLQLSLPIAVAPQLSAISSCAIHAPYPLRQFRVNRNNNNNNNCIELQLLIAGNGNGRADSSGNVSKCVMQLPKLHRLLMMLVLMSKTPHPLLLAADNFNNIAAATLLTFKDDNDAAVGDGGGAATTAIISPTECPLRFFAQC